MFRGFENLKHNLQGAKHDFKLILAQHQSLADFAKGVDGIESDAFNLIVEHVHEEVLGLVSKGSRLGSQLTD